MDINSNRQRRPNSVFVKGSPDYRLPRKPRRPQNGYTNYSTAIRSLDSAGKTQPIVSQINRPQGNRESVNKEPCRRAFRQALGKIAKVNPQVLNQNHIKNFFLKLNEHAGTLQTQANERNLLLTLQKLNKKRKQWNIWFGVYEDIDLFKNRTLLDKIENQLRKKAVEIKKNHQPALTNWKEFLNQDRSI